MINKLYQSINQGLKQIKDCTIYREDVEQFFSKPCFMVTLYDQNPTRGINKCLKNAVRVDIHYFPEDKVNYQEECWDIGQDLTREFQMQNFKIKNRNLKITDRVLHFLFDVDYREFRNETTPSMQTLSQKTDMKEV